MVGLNSYEAGKSWKEAKGSLQPTKSPLLGLELGDFAGLRLVSVRARFIREREIFGSGLLQHFLFSPPAEDRDQRAQGDD
jgi:hypothetical protein